MQARRLPQTSPEFSVTSRHLESLPPIPPTPEEDCYGGMKKTFPQKSSFETPSQISIAQLLEEGAHDLRRRFEAAMRMWGALADDQEIDWEAIDPALCAKMLPLAFTNEK